MACPSCGLQTVEEIGACQSHFHELLTREYSDFRFSRFHRTAVDAYCLQHPDSYCASAKSLMAHLGGLCCGIEHGGDPAAYSALQRSLNGTPDLEKPALPAVRGEVTIGAAMAASDPEAYGNEIERWANSVWEAYTPLHAFAREWMFRALQGQL